MSLSLRASLISLVSAASLLSIPLASAASLVIEQRSDTGIIGEWTLTQPNGVNVISARDEESRTITNAQEGIYTIRVTPPAGAVTTIRQLENNVIRQSVTDDMLNFVVVGATGSVIQVAYTYQGLVKVESTPSGAPFELTGPSGTRIVGRTPATFSDLAPGQYNVNYGIVTGCTLPRPVRRSLGANDNVTFTAEYICANASSSSSRIVRSSRSRSSQSSSVSSVEEEGSARVILTINPQEILPNGRVTVTVGIVNTSHKDLTNLTLTTELHPSLRLQRMPAEARQEGNTLVWDVPLLESRDRWSATYSASVAETVRTGDRLTLSAQAFGGDLASSPRTNTTVGVALLPRTGAGMDVLLALLGLLAPLPAVSILRRRQR